MQKASECSNSFRQLVSGYEFARCLEVGCSGLESSGNWEYAGWGRNLRIAAKMELEWRQSCIG